MGSVTGPPLPPTAPRAPALAVAVPFFAMAVVAGADLLAGPQIGFLPLLSLGPALAPVSLGPARTVLTGVLALLLSGLLASYDGTELSLHGVIAAATITGVTAVVLGAFRESAHDALDLTQITDQIELSLARQDPDEKFVTAILAEIAPDGAGISMVNCGHPSPLLITGAHGRFADPPEPALPLGLAQLGPHGRKEYSVTFGPRDRLLLYTDGISEARDKAGVFYPVGRAATLLAGPDLDEALERLYADVLRHTGGELADDSAALLLTRAPR